MKTIKVLSFAALLFMMISCGGYSNETAREYTRKLQRAEKKDEPLKQDEYLEIAQYATDAAIQYINESAQLEKEIADANDEDDKDKISSLKKKKREFEKKYKKLEDLMEEVEDLRYNTDDLDDETIEKIDEMFEKINEEIENLADKYELQGSSIKFP